MAVRRVAGSSSSRLAVLVIDPITVALLTLETSTFAGLHKKRTGTEAASERLRLVAWVPVFPKIMGVYILVLH